LAEKRLNLPPLRLQITLRIGKHATHHQHVFL
jgi:hypothetical protein